MYPRGENCSYRSQGSRRVSFSFFFTKLTRFLPIFNAMDVSLAFSPHFFFVWYFLLLLQYSLECCNVHISKLSAIYRHWGHGTERERTSRGQWFRFVLLSNNISNGHQKKTTDPTRPPPLEKKKWIKMDDDLITKNFDLMLGIVFHRRWWSSATANQIIINLQQEWKWDPHALTIYHCMVVHYNSHSLSLSLSLFYSCYNNKIERREYKETKAPFSHTFHGVPIYIYFFFIIIIIIIAAGPYIYTHTHTLCVSYFF
jgi:hypothetical protein